MPFSGAQRRVPHSGLIWIPLIFFVLLCSCHKNRSQPPPPQPISDSFNSVAIDQRTAPVQPSGPGGPSKIESNGSSVSAPPAASPTINISTSSPPELKQDHQPQCPRGSVTVVYPPPQCPSAVPTPASKPCDEAKAKAELEILLAKASLERDLGHWDKAADLYAQAMQSCAAPLSVSPGSPALSTAGVNSTRMWGDEWRDWVCVQNWPVWQWIFPWQWNWQLIRDWILPWRWGPLDPVPPDADTAGNFHYAQKQMLTWWWNWGAYFPPLRWAWTRTWPPQMWLLVWLIVLFLILSLSWRVLPKQRGLISWIGDGLKTIFMPPFHGRAHIMDPVGLTKDAEAGLFAQALQLAAAFEVNNRLGRIRSGLQAQSITMLSMPSVLANTAVQELPEIKGMDLGKIVKWLLTMVRYFGWRVESRIAYWPALKAGDGHPATSARMRVSASVRWAWFVRDTVNIDREVWDQYDVNAIAFAIAARISGVDFGKH